MTTRVMVLIDTLATGGAEHVAVDLACGLDRRRFAPHVVVTRCTGALHQRLDAAGIPVTVLGRRRRISFSAYRRARGIAETCDLIHAHKFSSNVWGALLARATRRPLIAHEHNWSGTPSPVRAVINRRWIAPVASRFLCVSTPVAEQLISGEVPAGLVRILRNPVSVDHPMPRGAARQQLGLPQDGFVVGIVARLRPEKNHELLLRATARLVAQNRELTICAIGDGPRRLHLEHLAKELGIADHLVWAGDVQEAGSLVAAFDVAVLCSAWEGLPLAVLEAMAGGVPVITTAVGGLPDLLADGAGLLIPPDDADGLAEAIVSLQDSPERARLIGATGCQRVQDLHNSASVIAALEDIYTEATRAAEVAP